MNHQFLLGSPHKKTILELIWVLVGARFSPH
jgi:hypothetical protein